MRLSSATLTILISIMGFFNNDQPVTHKDNEDIKFLSALHFSFYIYDEQ